MTASNRSPQPNLAGPPAIDDLAAQCAGAPDKVEPRIALAQALLRASRAAEALVPAEQAVALPPQLAAALEAREAVIAALQAGDPTLVRLEMAVILDPDNVGAHLILGEAYVAIDRPHDAERHFKRALALGRARDANADLASLYLSVGMHEAAEHHALAVLAGEDRGAIDDSAIAMAHQTLAGIAEARGDSAGGSRHLDLAYGRQSLYRQPAPGAAFITLILVTRKQGNLPYATLMPQDRYDRMVWYMEHARPEQCAGLPPYAVVLNAIGDPDIAMASQPAVSTFLSENTLPVLNPPERIQATFRHRIAETLAGIGGVVAPRTVRLAAPVIVRKGLPSAVEAAGLEPPVLVRPAGLHGGSGLTLARDAEALAATDVSGKGDIYVSAFHDYRSPDGYYRKYRMIFVDRKAFPYHLAISHRWMVHHETSEMSDDPARKGEELEFLREPAGAIGPAALAAIEAIGRRLDLDYAGVDFGITADGQVLVFEANATMLTHLEPEDGPFAAKNAFVKPIIEAFQARLDVLADVDAA